MAALEGVHCFYPVGQSHIALAFIHTNQHCTNTQPHQTHMSSPGSLTKFSCVLLFHPHSHGADHDSQPAATLTDWQHFLTTTQHLIVWLLPNASSATIKMPKPPASKGVWQSLLWVCCFSKGVVGVCLWFCLLKRLSLIPLNHHKPHEVPPHHSHPILQPASALYSCSLCYLVPSPELAILLGQQMAKAFTKPPIGLAIHDAALVTANDPWKGALHMFFVHDTVATMNFASGPWLNKWYFSNPLDLIFVVHWICTLLPLHAPLHRQYWVYDNNIICSILTGFIQKSITTSMAIHGSQAVDGRLVWSTVPLVNPLWAII